MAKIQPHECNKEDVLDMIRDDLKEQRSDMKSLHSKMDNLSDYMIQSVHRIDEEKASKSQVRRYREEVEENTNWRIAQEAKKDLIKYVAGAGWGLTVVITIALFIWG